jgi:hypothetical protein
MNVQMFDAVSVLNWGAFGGSGLVLGAIAKGFLVV